MGKKVKTLCGKCGKDYYCGEKADNIIRCSRFIQETVRKTTGNEKTIEKVFELYPDKEFFDKSTGGLLNQEIFNEQSEGRNHDDYGEESVP